MELDELYSAPGSVKPAKRVGRGPGSGHGKTSGRGHKGGQARAGYKVRAHREGGQMPIHMRLPKRGFHHGKRNPYAIINIDLLDKHFSDGDEVTAAVLIQRHLVADKSGGVKILGKGEITKALKLAVEAISPGAKTKIEAAGGSVVILGSVAVSEAATAEAAKE